MGLKQETYSEPQDEEEVEEEEREGLEVITYQHICTSCDHVVCVHKYGLILLLSPDPALAPATFPAQVRVLARGRPPGVPDGLSAVWHSGGQRVLHASRSQEGQCYGVLRGDDLLLRLLECDLQHVINCQICSM